MLRERAEDAERHATKVAEAGDAADDAAAPEAAADGPASADAADAVPAQPEMPEAQREALSCASKARSRLAGVLLSHGKMEEAEGEYERALEHATCARGEMHPESAAVAGALAHCYRRQGKLALAEEAFQQLITVHPNSPSAQENLLLVKERRAVNVI